MKKLLLLFISFCLVTSLPAQHTFQKAYGSASNDRFYNCIRTGDGGYLMSGLTVGTANSFYIIKTDSLGNFQWTRTYTTTGTGHSCEVTSAACTSDGGYILCGTSRVDDTLFHSSNAFLLKLAAGGVVQWSQQYGRNLELGGGVVQTADGGYMVSGATYYNNQNQGWLFRTDASGTIVWQQKLWSDGSCCSGGGVALSSLQRSADGNYLLSGSSWLAPANRFAGFLMKVTADDTLIWKHFIMADVEQVNDFRELPDKGFVMAGLNTLGGAVLRVDSMFSVQWGQKMSQLRPLSIEASADGSFAYTAQAFTLNNYLFDLSPGGAFRWAKAYGDTASGTALQLIANGDGYTLAGLTLLFGAGAHDISLTKTDLNGNSNCVEWPYTFTFTTPVIASSGIIYNDTIACNTTPISFTSAVGNAVETTLCDVMESTNDLEPVSTFSIFPNPFSNETTLQLANPLNDASLRLYDLSGRLVLQRDHINGSRLTIERGRLQSGMYMLRLLKDDRLIAAEKLIID